MNHLNFLFILTLLIISLHINYAFFRQNTLNISVVRNISCRIYGNTSSERNFQLCAIRIYRDWANQTNSSQYVFDGLRYTNAFRRFIEKHCPGWPLIDEIYSDAGFYRRCSPNLAYEHFEVVELCICTTDDCNSDWDSCYNSTLSHSNTLPLPHFMPDLNLTIQCNNPTDLSVTCNEHHFLQQSLCGEYIKNNSILCAINVNEGHIVQTSLIDVNYEIYLDKVIYEMRSASFIYQNSFKETNSSIFYNFSNNNVGLINECACTNSLCNQNISTCLLTASLSSSTIAPITQTTIITATAGSRTYDRGLGTAATAGIACGIILSVVIFTAEYIILNYFCSNAQTRGAERSVAYRA